MSASDDGGYPIFYGLADSRLVGSELGEVIEFFPSRKQAEEVLRQVLADEPSFEGMLEVVKIDLSRTVSGA